METAIDMSDRDLDFRKLHETYVERIRLYLEKLVGRVDAEDLTQEVFAKVSKSLKAFRGESQPSTWIYRIATNTARDRIRQKARTGDELSLELAGEREDKNLWTGEILPLDQQVIRREMNDCIRNVIAKLPDRYRTIIVLSELEGFRNEEIAGILGIGLEAVKIRLHRGRAKLKEELSRFCILYRDDRNEFACDLKEGVEIHPDPPKIRTGARNRKRTVPEGS